MLNAKKGFTLSELLVSLAVLGLIAAFAVPKVLTAVGNSTILANAKEALSTISGAYESYKADVGGIVPTTASLALDGGVNSLISKMNFSQTGTYTQTAVATPDTFVVATAAASNSIRFANNAILTFNPLDNFTQTAWAATTFGKVHFNVDPDGTGVTKPFSVVLGFDGRLFIPNSAATMTIAPFSNYVTGGNEVALITPNAINTSPTAAGVDYQPYYNGGMVSDVV